MITYILFGSTLLLEYTATVNQYATAVIGTSIIQNIVSATATGITIPLTANNIIPVASYASVTVEKTMSPNPVVDGSPITYTFVINNYGTIPATDVVLQDIFTTTPTITSVTLNGTPTTEYSFTAGTFQFPSAASTFDFSIPAATFTQDPTTGVVTVVPGTATLVISGTI